VTGDRLLTAAEIADLLGLSPATILDRFERGDLPGFRLFGRKGGPVRFRESEIAALVESWRVGGGVTPATPSPPAAGSLHSASNPNVGGDDAR
jgi:excisionase family DNA binding protein